MTQGERILAARALLVDITPLKRDCGRLCGAACCQPDADGRGGMLLFPGEEALYDPVPDWAEITDSGFLAGDKQLAFLTCNGTCPRENRPLACRIFPMTPLASENGVTAEMDVRAWAVCLLMGHGKDGLSREFVAAVRAAMAIIWEDAQGRAYIEALTESLKAYTMF